MVALLHPAGHRRAHQGGLQRLGRMQYRRFGLLNGNVSGLLAGLCPGELCFCLRQRRLGATGRMA